MTQPLPILLAAGLFAGGAAGVASSVLMAPDAPASDSQVVDSTSSDLVAALDELQSQNRALLDRVETLEAQIELAPIAGSAPSRTPSTVSETELQDLVREALASLEPDAATGTVNPAMAQVVENVLEMREERERLEREQRRAQAEDERMENRLADLQSKLGLDQNQVASMRTILQDERARQNEMRDKMREARDSGTMDMRGMRDAWTEMRASTNQSVQGVLTPAQYEQYEESQQNSRWGGRRGGDDDGGGGQGGSGRRGN